MSRVVARVQSHPSRRIIRERLLDGLKPLPTEVVETDFDPPNPWGGYKECLRSIVDEDCSHVLIVQDDAIACHNLAAALERIVEVVPNLPVCLFLPGVSVTKKPALQAAKRGETFVDIVPRGFVPVVAVLWPKPKAMHFLEWARDPRPLIRGNGQRIEQRSDDAMAYLWMHTQSQRVLATIPCLVQHPDDVPSTIARRPARRTALFWNEHPWDPLSINWCFRP